MKIHYYDLAWTLFAVRSVGGEPQCDERVPSEVEEARGGTKVL